MTQVTTARVVVSEFSENHIKILYLISLYAVAANSTKINERWLRHIPLLVFMFEGIVTGKLDLDYAPASVRLSVKGKALRRWINVSREGKSVLDDLIDAQLINGIKLSSDDFQPVTAYQVSDKGVQLLHERLEAQAREEVESFLYPPPPQEHRLLVILYSGDKFYLRGGAFSKASLITECEDVSYVSSPYLPRCLRRKTGYRVQPNSNKHRAKESAAGLSNITSNPNEEIVLGNVCALVGEWVPFGSNQIVALNERMGSLDRCQGGILTSAIDNSPTETEFRLPLGQTEVRILDFDFVRFINFEAESHFPESEGIVQIESFGMHLNCDGSLIFGMEIDAIMDRASDNLSIDHLSRLLVDIHQDSTLLVNDLLSQYQLRLLDMLYLGDSYQRNKYNCLLASQITPKLSAKEYLASPSLANELEQILGDIVIAHDLTSDDVLLVGKAGCLVAGPNAFKHEHLVTAYVGLVSRDLFIKNFFARTFVLDATLKETKYRIHASSWKNPQVTMEVRDKLSQVSRDTILLAETLEYLLDSLKDVQLVPLKEITGNLSARISETGRRNQGIDAGLLDVLQLDELKNQTIVRCHDCVKLMENAMLQLEQLQTIAKGTAANRLEESCQRVGRNTHTLATAHHQHRSNILLKFLRDLVAGLFVFDVIDRLTGGTWNVHLPKWAIDSIVAPVMHQPFAWWGINILCYGGFACLLSWTARWLWHQTLGKTVVTANINKAIKWKHLQRLLVRRGVILQTITSQIGGRNHAVQPFKRRVIKWQSRRDVQLWGGSSLEIDFSCDEKHEFLYAVSLHFDANKTTLRDEEIVERLQELFIAGDIFESEENLVE